MHPGAESRWLGRFERPAPIRRMGAFHLYRAFADGSPRVVAISRPEVDPDRARDIVAQVVRVHGSVQHPAVPPVAERGRLDDLYYVAFACEALCDLESVIEQLGAALPERLPPPATAALLGATVEVLTAIHVAGQPGRAGVGRLSTGHILFGPSGQLAFIGLGTDLLSGQGPAMPRRFEAPEYEATRDGRRMWSPANDVFLVGALATTLVPLETPRPGLTRVRLGTGPAEQVRLWRQLTAKRTAGRFSDLVAVGEALATLWPTPDPGAWATLLGPLGPLFAADAPGMIIAGRYRLERRLGFGRRGAWFVAWDRHLEQTVAIKWMRAGVTERDRARLLREVNLLRKLRHPNVMAGYDVIVDEARIGAVMEYVPGEPLSELLRHEDVPRNRLASRLAGIADALAYLAREGVVHRDVKPANIVLHDEREAVLVDLGLARSPDSRSVTHPHERLGTFRFMAPEQLSGAPPTPALDVFALCTVLLEVLLPEPLMNHPGPALARGALAEAGVPKVLADLIAAGVSPDPKARPGAERLAEALRALEPPAGQPAAIVVAADGRWFQLDAQTVDLRRRGALRRILAALVQHHAEQGPSLDVTALQHIGWPGERMSPESGRNRVYTAISTLRSKGMDCVLERLDEGYRLSPTALIRRVDAHSMPPMGVPPPRF